jgi:hypothetical protein
MNRSLPPLHRAISPQMNAASPLHPTISPVPQPAMSVPQSAKSVGHPGSYVHPSPPPMIGSHETNTCDILYLKSKGFL